MQGYPYAPPPPPPPPPSGPPREGHKNYVFVDEHNRHKRLKVMRACSGCRKRKIKCDAATTNIWPCSACTRLKLVCVPPTGGQDGSISSAEQEGEAVQTGFLGASGTPDTSHNAFSFRRRFGDNSQSAVGDITPYSGEMHLFQNYSTQPSASQSDAFSEVQAPHIAPSRSAYQHPQTFSASQGQPLGSTDPGLFGGDVQSTADGLSEVLGELKIDETGIAPYIRQQKESKIEPDVPVQDEAEEKLPPLSTRAGSAIRIPPELMPSDDEVLDYFEIYFRDIHPYVPVIHRSHLYWQWEHDRTSISPLLLESLFASAGRFSDNPAQGAQWLALANRHEPNFMDVPRLSTIQALLLLLKARESTPKKGYYYRSWQCVKTMVSMSKDLDIHEHYSLHAEGKSCELDSVDCLVQTRVWQALLVVELMTGAPQGRSDYGVDPETVDMRPVLDIAGLDQFEINRSKQYAYFVRNVHNIRIITDVFHQLKKKQADWAANPRFVEMNPLFSEWLRSLPPELQVNYPADGSPPWIPSHFVANMHSHCHLGIILLHRPQLVASRSFSTRGDWKAHMALCYSSAKKLCRLQEAILAYFGLPGLLFMQRGINFGIYCILTCTMLHLVAITSPYPEFHCDARDFFTRHMRILEQCSSAWPMPEIQAQIDSLRLAFSADVNRAFELKPTFPYGSPSEPYQPSPPLDLHYNAPLNPIPNTYHSTATYGAHPITPPISAGPEGSKSDSSQLQTFGIIQHNPPSQPYAAAPLVDENSWDPTRIINHWDNAFSVTPAANINTDSPPMTIHTLSSGLPNSTTTDQYPVHYGSFSRISPVTSTQPVSQSPFSGQQSYITAREWQQNVASVYDPHGLKRRCNYSVGLDSGNYAKRQR